MDNKALAARSLLLLLGVGHGHTTAVGGVVSATFAEARLGVRAAARGQELGGLQQRLAKDSSRPLMRLDLASLVVKR